MKSRTTRYDIDFDNIVIEDVEIFNFVASKDNTQCSVKIKGKAIEGCDYVWGEEIGSAEALSRVRNDVKVYIEEDIEEVEDTSITKEMKEEADEIVQDAQPIHQVNPIQVLRNVGFNGGAVVKRRDAFGAPKGYGILTGEIRDQNDGGHAALCTDNSWFHVAHLEVIDDVNKYVLRTIQAEKMRIMEEAQSFCQLIDKTLDDIVYGED
jgi:hypothetical protein